VLTKGMVFGDRDVANSTERSETVTCTCENGARAVIVAFDRADYLTLLRQRRVTVASAAFLALKRCALFKTFSDRELLNIFDYFKPQQCMAGELIESRSDSSLQFNIIVSGRAVVSNIQGFEDKTVTLTSSGYFGEDILISKSASAVPKRQASIVASEATALISLHLENFKSDLTEYQSRFLEGVAARDREIQRSNGNAIDELTKWQARSGADVEGAGGGGFGFSPLAFIGLGGGGAQAAGGALGDEGTTDQDSVPKSVLGPVFFNII